jgi:hypothetical protein
MEEDVYLQMIKIYRENQSVANDQNFEGTLQRCMLAKRQTFETAIDCLRVH